jgi:hypothetical protein
MAPNCSSPNTRPLPQTLRPRPQRHDNIAIDDDGKNGHQDQDNSDHEDTDDEDYDEDEEDNNESEGDVDDEEKLKRLRTRRSGPEPFLPNDMASQRERALAAINAYTDNPLGDDPGVADSTEKRRNYHWKAWRRYGAILHH